MIDMDGIVRVFHVKVKYTIKLLTKGCIFGLTRCHMYSVDGRNMDSPTFIFCCD